MTYDPRHDVPLRRAVNRFADAVTEYAFIGTIPVIGQDREEQEAIDGARGAIIRERQRAEKLLLDMIGRRVNKGEKP